MYCMKCRRSQHHARCADCITAHDRLASARRSPVRYPARRYGNAVSASANRAACWIRISIATARCGVLPQRIWRRCRVNDAGKSSKCGNALRPRPCREPFEAPAMPGTLPGDLNAWSIDGRTLRRLLSHFSRISIAHALHGPFHHAVRCSLLTSSRCIPESVLRG